MHKNSSPFTIQYPMEITNKTTDDFIPFQEQMEKNYVRK